MQARSISKSNSAVHQHLQVETNLEALPAVLNWFNGHCEPQLSRQMLIQCQTILAEGFTNAVRHAHRDKSSQTPIELELSLLENQIELRIWDSGPEFDLEQRLRDSPNQPAAEAVGGRGIQLIARLADSYSYRRTDSRNCLQITKATEVETP
jgi:serine/threonine-protein kinase RsbW